FFLHFVKIFTISDNVAWRAKNVKELNRRFPVVDDVVFEQRTFGDESLLQQSTHEDSDSKISCLYQFEHLLLELEVLFGQA
nr:hypothetical protein [Tanacetum cinerariifolium]